MNPPEAIHESYTRRIWRRFHADTMARNGFRTIIVLFIIAALAPFLANSHAIVRVAHGRVTFPVFPSLEPIEWRFLLYVPLAGLAWLLRRRLLTRPWRGAGLLLAVIVLIEIWLAYHHVVNDPSNDRDRPATFKWMPLVAYSPLETASEPFLPPSWTHPCGTDSTGRDIAARMLHGARTSLSIGFVAQSIALSVGVTLGSLAGYYRRWLDIVICRLIEIMDCFPPLLLVLVAISLTESQNHMFYIMVVIGLTTWTGVARLVRGEFLRLSNLPFTLAAQAGGAGDLRVIVRHILPNALGPILVVGTFGVASAILLESSLSFLGFGMQAPTPSWGDILNESRLYIDFAWWLAFFPGFAILITIMSYNFVGEGLRDAVDPRLRIK
ncbi:MAG TPA: ABC transporter permease [Candidatus Methylacidiphilales bacterium]|nr:ABC transporter permease [Candidatus Methylacidiphilales bacterium]